MSEEGQFNSDFLGPDAQQTIEALVSQWLSDGALGKMITQQLGPMLGLNNLTDSYANVNGSRVYAGSSSLFGPQRTGSFLNNTWDNQAIADIMQPAAQAIESARVDFRKQVYRKMWDDDHTNPTGFSVTNMGADWLFNQRKADRIADGVAQAARLQGVGSVLDIADPTARDAAMLQQEGFKRIGSITATDFLKSPQKYGGLDGAEVGELIATMSSRGQITDQEVSKLSGDIDRELGEADKIFIEKLQNTAKAVGELKRVFQGSMSQVLEQANRITGADLTATFGDETIAMTRGMAVTGQMTGFTGTQMASLANISSQMSARMGADTFGSLDNASRTARLFAASRGVDMAFVDPNRLRSALQESVSGAQSSEMARDIAGAAAIVEQSLGKEGLTDFKNLISTTELDGSPEAVRKLLSQTLDIPEDQISLAEIRDASFSKRGEQLRAQGIGTDASRTTYAREMLNSRRKVLERMNIKGLDVASLTDAQLADVDALAKNLGVEERGAINRAFSNLGGIGSSFEEDAFLQSSLNSEKMKAFEARFQRRMSIEDQTAEFNKTDGLTNISMLLSDKNKDLSEMSFKEMAAYIAGGTIDIDALKGSKSDVAKSLKAVQEFAKSGEGTKNKSLAEMAIQVSSTGQFNGKSFTKDQRNQLFKILTSSKDPAEIQKGIADFMGEHGNRDMMFDTEVDALAYELNGGDENADDPVSKATKGMASDIVSLEQLATLDKDEFTTKDFKSAKGGISGDAVSKYKKTAQKVADLMRDGKLGDKKYGLEDRDTMEEALSLVFEGDEDKIKDFMAKSKAIGAASDDAEFRKGAVGSMGDQIIAILGQILTALSQPKNGSAPAN